MYTMALGFFGGQWLDRQRLGQVRDARLRVLQDLVQGNHDVEVGREDKLIRPRAGDIGEHREALVIQREARFVARRADAIAHGGRPEKHKAPPGGRGFM